MTAPLPSRPLRSFGLVLIGWVMIRTFAIWADNSLPVAAVELAAAPVPQIAHGPVKADQTTILAHDFGIVIRSKPARSRSPTRVATSISHPPLQIFNPTMGNFAEVARDPLRALAATSPATAPYLPGQAITPDKSKRWSGSAWLLARVDGPAALGTGGELGGSQAGARLFYTIAEPIAVTARASRPLTRSAGGEASIGIAMRHHNIGLLLERRIALDRGGRNDFSVTAYGGLSDVDLGHKLRLDGYAQAGVVGTDKFADGAIRIARPMATVAGTGVALGAGVWGGAQPGIARIDVGPQIVAHIPIEGRAARLSAEWRERIAGQAAPASGPALTLGIDL